MEGQPATTENVKGTFAVWNPCSGKVFSQERRTHFFSTYLFQLVPPRLPRAWREPAAAADCKAQHISLMDK